MTDVWYCEPPPCSTTDTDYVVATWECEPPPPPPCYEPPKGNNGWGNGEDGDNPGTTKGNDYARNSKMNVDGFEWKFGGR